MRATLNASALDMAPSLDLGLGCKALPALTDCSNSLAFGQNGYAGQGGAYRDHVGLPS